MKHLSVKVCIKVHASIKKVYLDFLMQNYQIAGKSLSNSVLPYERNFIIRCCESSSYSKNLN